MVSGEPLRRRREDLAGAALGLLLGLLLDPAQREARLAPRVDFDFLDQRLPRLVSAQRGDPFELEAPQLGELSVQRLQPVQSPFSLRAVAA